MQKKNIFWLVSMVVLIGISIVFFSLFRKNDDTVEFYDYTTAKDKYEDVKAWINIPNTRVNYPIMQHKTDNAYYHNRDEKGELVKYGSIYSYKNVKFDGDNKDKNLIIYGHNMGSGSHFATLQNFSSLEFYKQNPYIEFETSESKDKYVVVGAFYTSTIKQEDNEYRFNYHSYNNFTPESFSHWKKEIDRRNMYITGMDYTIDDEFITLQTCKEAIYYGATYVVIARKVREEEIIDTSNFKVNDNMYVPSSWDVDRIYSLMKW